jgi:serine/threonine-protein kinase RsbW
MTDTGRAKRFPSPDTKIGKLLASRSPSRGNCSQIPAFSVTTLKPTDLFGIVPGSWIEEEAMPESKQNPPRCEFETDKLLIQLDALIPSDIAVIDHAVGKIVRLIEKSNCWDDTENMDLALREALANAIVHGNQSEPKKTVRICVGIQPDCGILPVVRDAGSGFDPTQLPNPVMGQNLFAAHGRGIFLINQLMQDVRFSFDHGTAIHMRWSRPSRP